MITGIIAEYNIFHNGHKYQIDSIKKEGDAVVAVMSGSFVQRGDVAVTDKWTRTKTALICGADLVIELPVCCALNAAPNFASGGIGILNTLGVVDSICFGSESGNIDEIQTAAELMENESIEVSQRVKALVSKGLSYPAALSEAYKNIIDPCILSEPNNILAVEYMRALLRSGSTIKPVTVKRYASGHHDTNITNNIASASKLREMLKNGEDISSYIPYPSAELGKNIPFDISALNSAVISKLRTMNSDSLKNISEVSEGLENRLLQCAAQSDSFEGIVKLTKNKRYTESKIRRIVLAALINFTKDIYSPMPQYIRVLGMNKTGMSILKAAKEKCSVPIITKTADYKGDSTQLALDIRSTDIAVLCSPQNTSGGLDFINSPVIIA